MGLSSSRILTPPPSFCFSLSSDQAQADQCCDGRLDLSYSNSRNEIVTEERLNNLKQLNLSNSFMFQVPVDLNRLQNLQVLSLSHCNLQELPAGLAELQNLHTLVADHNNLSSIPAKFEDLRSLERLELSANCLVQLPDSFFTLKALRVLNLSANRIKELPKEIENLEQLEELGFSYNKVCKIPDLRKLRNLRILTLGHCGIETIDATFLPIEHLEILNLGDNKLTKVQAGLFQVPRLKYLNLCRNLITDLGLDLRSCTQRTPYDQLSRGLCHLNLSENLFLELPRALDHMPACEVKIHGNPLSQNINHVPQRLVVSLVEICVNKMLRFSAIPTEPFDYYEMSKNITIMAETVPHTVRHCFTKYKICEDCLAPYFRGQTLSNANGKHLCITCA